MLQLLFTNPLIFALVFLALVISISIHEFAHAYTADRLGDPTPRYLGRVTLNPLAHLDPMGTLLLVVAGFGWGNPVPFNPTSLKHPRRDTALVAFAGPLSNFLLALMLSLVMRVFEANIVIDRFLYLIVFYNLILGFFNLIPVAPLDGFKVVHGLLPIELSFQWIQMERFGIFILLLLLLTGSIERIVFPLVSFVLGILGVA